MHDIGEFARRAATEFLEKQSTVDIDRKLGLPLEEVERLVKAAFYASLIPDEGRWPSVTIMCYRKGTQAHFLFHRASEISPGEIAKLAHAVQAGSHIHCVCDNGTVTIGGIHVTRLNDYPQLGYATFRTPNPLKLVIRGPGRIDFSSGGGALEYSAGEIREESLLMNSVVVERLATTIKNEMEEAADESIEILPDVINDITKKISQLGHGGLMLFADTPKKSHFSPHRELLWCDILNDAILEYREVITDLANVTDGIGTLLERVERNEDIPGLLKVALAVTKIEKAIETIAHLAGMDGAIVFDNSLQIGAFNAIIDRSLTASTSPLTDGRGRSIDEASFMKRRGSRHQSALLFCRSVPNAFALVISQDGSVTAFHNDGNSIICESEMRVM